MWSTKSFADSALDAGLNEVTFSMHGHTAALHDELTGVKGSFAQAIKGMLNLLGRAVVNIDIVINGMNYAHLDDIIRFFQRLGIHEFDLLQITPFGRAWKSENRERLFYDMEKAWPHLNLAFRNAYRPGNFIWTNRFPAAYLEGVEDLIQDPHKILDEARGRRAEFMKLIENGEPLQCRDDRCGHCFMQKFCADLQRLVAMVQGMERTDELHIDLRSEKEVRIFAGMADKFRGIATPSRIHTTFSNIDKLFDFLHNGHYQRSIIILHSDAEHLEAALRAFKASTRAEPAGGTPAVYADTPDALQLAMAEEVPVMIRAEVGMAEAIRRACANLDFVLRLEKQEQPHLVLLLVLIREYVVRIFVNILSQILLLGNIWCFTT